MADRFTDIVKEFEGFTKFMTTVMGVDSVHTGHEYLANLTHKEFEQTAAKVAELNGTNLAQQNKVSEKALGTLNAPTLNYNLGKSGPEVTA